MSTNFDPRLRDHLRGPELTTINDFSVVRIHDPHSYQPHKWVQYFSNYSSYHQRIHFSSHNLLYIAFTPHLACTPLFLVSTSLFIPLFLPVAFKNMDSVIGVFSSSLFHFSFLDFPPLCLCCIAILNILFHSFRKLFVAYKNSTIMPH